MHRVFLDANVIFSAAYTSGSRLRELWFLDDVQLVTSMFALEEARRNLLLDNPKCIEVLDELASEMTIVAGTRTSPLPEGIDLASKDIPILLAAIDSGCNHLITGDRRHFEALYGRNICGVLVQTPGQYLRNRTG